MKHLSVTRIFKQTFLVCFSFACMVTGGMAGEPSHGLSIFGQETLKYGPGEPFEYLNPDAPIGGRLKLSGGYFTKLSPFGLTGTPPPLMYRIFDTLGIKSWDDDEPFAVYGLLAESFDLADDKLSMVVRLRPEARFADGEPVLADDVVFSYDLLFDPNVNPAARLSWANVKSVEAVDDHTVKFTFTEYSRDLPITVTYLTVYPRHVYGVPGANLGKDFDDVLPVGSGPYEIESYTLGERVTLRRREDYWAKNLPYCKGFFNWKHIEFQAYYDTFSEIEALKTGHIDFMSWLSPVAFEKLGGEFFDRGYIVKEQFPLTRPSAMKAIAFNMRNPIFQDRRLRKVIASLYDFDFINSNFFYDTQDRLTSYFLRQPHLRASPGPAEGQVREILLDLADRHNTDDAVHVPPEALEVGSQDAGQDAAGNPVPMGVRIEAANRELDRLGWHWDAEAGARRRGDQELRFEIIDAEKGIFHFTETLQRVGIQAKAAKLSRLEEQNRTRTFRFDMRAAWYDGRYAPGRELARSFLSDEADTPGSMNTMGLKNPAVDEVLEVLMTSLDYEEVGVYARVFDRIMMNQTYVVPKFWPRVNPGVYWNYMRRPEKYCSGLWFYYNVLWYWWEDADARAELESAMAEGRPFER